MTIVDSTVWIDFFRGQQTPHVSRLRALFDKSEIGLGDLMLCEILQGVPNEREATRVEALLRQFQIIQMGGDAIAVAAARNYRLLRERGVTVRKTIDIIIGTWCIENGCALLHSDRDFHPMAQHLGLIEMSA